MDNCNLKWLFISVCILIMLTGLYLAFTREKRNINKGNRDLQDGGGNLKEGSFNLKFAIGLVLIAIGLAGGLYCLKNIPGCEALPRSEDVKKIVANPSIDITHLCTVSASHYSEIATPEMAVDGDKNTSWNSGDFPPQYIKLAIPEFYLIDSVLLLVDQSLHTTHTESSDGNIDEAHTVHKLSIQTYENLNWELKRVFNDNTRNNQKLIYIPPHSLSNIQYLKVETTESKSWVAWKEIQVFGHSSR